MTPITFLENPLSKPQILTIPQRTNPSAYFFVVQLILGDQLHLRNLLGNKLIRRVYSRGVRSNKKSQRATVRRKIHREAFNKSPRAQRTNWLSSAYNFPTSVLSKQTQYVSTRMSQKLIFAARVYRLMLNNSSTAPVWIYM